MIFPGVYIFPSDSVSSWLDTLEGRFFAETRRNAFIRCHNTRDLLSSTGDPTVLRQPWRQVSEARWKFEQCMLYITRALFQALCEPRFRRFYGVHYLMQVAYLLVLVSLILHNLDRQVEYTSRMDILWKSKLRVEQDEVETMRGINKILLENILPAHVADHFLATRAMQVDF